MIPGAPPLGGGGVGGMGVGGGERVHVTHVHTYAHTGTRRCV